MLRAKTCTTPRRLQVFALSGLKDEADAANTGYFAVRGLLAKSVAEAACFIVDRGVVIPFRRRCHPEACGASRASYRRAGRCGR